MKLHYFIRAFIVWYFKLRHGETHIPRHQRPNFLFVCDFLLFSFTAFSLLDSLSLNARAITGRHHSQSHRIPILHLNDLQGSPIHRCSIPQRPEEMQQRFSLNDHGALYHRHSMSPSLRPRPSTHFHYATDTLVLIIISWSFLIFTYLFPLDSIAFLQNLSKIISLNVTNT